MPRRHSIRRPPSATPAIQAKQITKNRVSPSDRRQVEKASDVQHSPYSPTLVTPVGSPMPSPPTQPRSALRARRTEGSEESTSSPGRRLQFNHVDVFYFEREQGSCSVPAAGEICLGMVDRHHHNERLSLSGSIDLDVATGETMEKEEGLSPISVLSSPHSLPLGNRTTAHSLSPVVPTTRSRLLRASGVKIDRASLSPGVNQSIRESRKPCGCSCAGGVCHPDTCECARDGVPCMVEDEANEFPCKCAAASCANPEGRQLFDSEKIHSANKMTLQRLLDRENVESQPSSLPTVRPRKQAINKRCDRRKTRSSTRLVSKDDNVKNDSVADGVGVAKTTEEPIIIDLTDK